MDKDEKLKRKKAELTATSLQLHALNIDAANRPAESARRRFVGLEPQAFLKKELEKLEPKMLRELRASADSSNGEATRVGSLARTIFKEEYELMDTVGRALRLAEQYVAIETYIRFIECFQEEGFISWRSYKNLIEEVG